MILATDLDRTLLPNGHDLYDGSLPVLFSLLETKDLSLVYVSGRNKDEFIEARKKYGIKKPDYFIAEVGTVMYQLNNSGELEEVGEWIEKIHDNHPDWNREKIVEVLPTDDYLFLQESEHQNVFKISLYLSEQSRLPQALKDLQSAFESLGVETKIVESYDPLKELILIDIMPKGVDKLSALEFLRKKLDNKKEEVFYCGDSGNDITALTFGYRSVLVGNAPEEIKEEVQKISDEKGLSDSLYVAQGEVLNGNYSSGIIEGLVRFGLFTEEEVVECRV